MVKTDGTSDRRGQITQKSERQYTMWTGYSDEQRKAEDQIKFFNDQAITLIDLEEQRKDLLDCEWKAKVARNRWKDKAKQKMLRQIEESNKALRDLIWMKKWCSIAQEALEAKNIDSLLEAFTKIHLYRNKYGNPVWNRSASSEWGSEGGLISERPPNSLNVVLIEIGKEIESYDTPDVKAWWQSLTSPSDCTEGVGYKYEFYYEMELYRYHLDGDQRVTGREIEQELYRIRKEQNK